MPDQPIANIAISQTASGSWTVQLNSSGSSEPENPSPKDFELSRASLMTEIFKALLLINGGGAVALLTLVKDSTGGTLPIAAAQGAMSMSAGLVAAIFSAVFRFWHSIAAQKAPGTGQQIGLRVTYLCLIVLSALLFAFGAVWVGSSSWQSLVAPAAVGN